MSETALSAIAEINPGVRIPKEITGSDEVSFIPMGDVSESGDWLIRQTRPLHSVTAGFTAFEESDVLVAKITPCLENGKGAHAQGLRNGIGFGSTEFHVLRARQGVDPRFVFHVTQSQRFRQAAERQMVGSAGQQRVQRQFFDEFPVKEFSQSEQRAIVKILDTLDIAIRETEALIDKLKAVKQGLLHDLLTRGIDANGQLRPPQSEAPQLYKESPLGCIPREWEVLPLGICADVTSGVTLGRILNSPVAIELPYLRVANVQDGYLALEDIKTVSILPSELNRFALKVGDVLMNEGGDFDKLGRGAVWEGQIEPCLHQNHVFRVRCDDSKLLPTFLAAYSSSVRGKSYFVQASKQTTNLASINSTQLKAFGITCPSLTEQLAIAQRLSTFDKKMTVEQEALEKLRQQKIGLMDDLLTGRVRVTPLLESTQCAAAPTGT